ncbi:Vacuolar protein sorting-associated protein 13 [Pleurotus pulmonarius]
MPSSSTELCQLVLGFLKHFVDGFNEDNVVASFLSQGSIILRDLRILETLVDILSLPVDVAGGRIGLLEVSVRPGDANEERILVSITHVHLLLKPLLPPWNIAEEYGLRILAAKLLRLQLSELLDAILLGGVVSRSFLDFARRVYFTLNDVHVRYEGAGDSAMGLTMGTIVCGDMKGSDERSQPTEAVTRMVEITNICIYATTTESQVPLPQRSNKSSESFSIPPPPAGSLLLQPLSASVKFNISDTASGPLVDLQIYLPEIKVTLTDGQYECIHDSVLAMLAWKRRWKYRRFRPPPEEFANNRAQAYLRSWAWAYLKQRRDDRQSYISLFLRRREASLLQQEAENFHALERKLSPSDLRFYRLAALRSTRGVDHPLPSNSSPDVISEGLLRLNFQIPGGSVSLQVASVFGRREILRVDFDALCIALTQTLDGQLATAGSLWNLSALANAQALVSVKEPVKDGENNNDEPFLKWAYDTKSGKIKINVVRTEIIYDKEFVDAMLGFFQIPPEQLQSVEAFLTLAMQTIEANEQLV